MRLLAGALVLGLCGAAAAQEIRVEGGGGTLAPGAAEQAIAQAAPELQACYQEHAGRYVGGHVSLAVRVGTDGKNRRAQVGASDLGSWEVERCLVGVARKLALGAPRGGEVTVSVPLDFQAAAAAAPMGEAQLKEAAAKLRALPAGCGKAHGTQVAVYVGPGGQILSIGFGDAPSDRWAECAAARARQITLADPRGQVVKGVVSP
jgi:hypothetical protein